MILLDFLLSSDCMLFDAKKNSGFNEFVPRQPLSYEMGITSSVISIFQCATSLFMKSA